MGSSFADASQLIAVAFVFDTGEQDKRFTIPLLNHEGEMLVEATLCQLLDLTTRVCVWVVGLGSLNL